jgi:predicted GTPase
MSGRERRRIVIVGAAGRDFHDFLVLYREDAGVEVVAFTATQIPGVCARRLPASIAGPLYPEGIPIRAEADLEAICAADAVDDVVFAYSDVAHEAVMHIASRALAAGADFRLLGPRATMLASTLPVIGVSAVRTGCGKSQIARFLSADLRERGLRVAVLRHPMPYGDLARQRVQRFETLADLDAAECTAEEREEYEPHLAARNLLFAGVDYREILRRAERESDILLWDGGNNDFPFITPDLHLVVVDALRPDQVATHHPGETVLWMADVVIINKVDAAGPSAVERLIAAVRAIKPSVPIVRAASPVQLDDAAAVKNRTVLVVEDGPTTTHGGMAHGAGYVAARAAGAAAIIDPRPYAVGSVREVFAQNPHLGPVLPAIGYTDRQRLDLAATLDSAPAEIVVSGAPLDLARLVPTRKPVVRARYAYADAGAPSLSSIVSEFLAHPWPRIGG